MSATLGGQARCLVNVNITRDHSKGHGSAALLRTGISVEVREVHAQTPVCLASLGILYEVQAEDSRDKASGATLLLQVTAPSDDCTRPIDKIEVTLAKARSDADEDLFFLQTNVPELRGVAWRKLINQLRAQYASSTALAPPDDSEPEHLNPYFICKWLARGAQSHTIILPDTLVTPSFLHHSPAADTLSELLNKHSPRRCQVQLTISAPADYSHFDFVDLTLTLGQELTTQFARSKDLLDLDSACFFQWLAITASPELHDPTSQIAVTLEFMETLEEWYRHTRIYDVLFDGIELLGSMMALASAMSSDDLLNDRLTNSYASMLMAGLCPTYVPDPRFEAALTQFEARMVSHPSQHPSVLNNFGYFFRKASEKMIRSDKLDISISSLRKSLELLPPDDGLRVEVFQNLVISLYARHRTNRNLEDLEFALLCFCEAKRLQERGIGSIPRWKLLLEFAKAAQDVDLEETVRALKESYQLCPLDDPSRYSVLAYLADALFKQYHRRKCISNLDKAMAYVKTALELAPSGQLAVRAYLLLRLASILSQKTLDAEAPCDEEFDEAIRIAQESLDIYGRDERRYLALQVLGVAHVRRYLWRKDVEDALAAHQCLSDALAAADAGIPSTHRAEYLASLAEIHLFPDTPLYDIMRACQYSRMCLDDPHTDAVNKLTYMGVAFHPSRVGEHFSSSSSETHSAIADLFLRAVDLLPEIAHLGMDIKSSLNVLRGWESLPIVTSHLCSRSKRYHDAVLTIEKGRAIFWAQALKLRFRANDSVSHALREQLSQLARRLEHNRHLPKRQSSMPIRDSVQSRRLGQQYESVLQQVRELSGNEAFAALSKEELMRIGEQGPVVVLTAHERVCTAYIFTHDDGENGSRLIVHTLAEVSSQKLGEYASKMTETNLRTRNGPTRDMELESPIDSPISPSGTSFSFNIAKAMERAVRMKRPRRQRTFKDDVLRPLFYEVVKPILIALRLKPSSGRSRPRLWWCPTGVFTSLPIHAAGDYFPGGECCSDYVVSSYTPTCTSLLTARKAFSPIKLKDAKVLLAAVPHPFNGRTLTGTVAELKQISDIIPRDQHIPLPDSDNPMISSEAGITSTTILDKLPEASILHLASHGVQDYQSPLDSGFILRDTKLTISQLMPLPLPHAFLAFLSACETAKGDREQTDQAIHLASTMLFAGFKSVVGTLWTMSDSDGPFVASYLYEELFKGGQDYLDPDVVPYALDEVVRRLRGKNASSTRWATFVHLGM